MVKIVAFIQMFNEVKKGNLRRCLENCKQWADDIAIYDDASTDDSVAVAREYTPHILLGKQNAFHHELAHKQELLQLALTLNPDWIMWVDCDEILDRHGTTGGLRTLAETARPEIDVFAFREVNLWRSQTYARKDAKFESARFPRLWRVIDGICFKIREGLHHRLVPITNTQTEQSSIRVIHYGFWAYKRMLEKIGAMEPRKQFHAIARKNWILDERGCDCYRVPTDWFPEENVPPDIWPQPQPRAIEDLLPYSELDYD